jgi:hypothetical protein
MAELHKLPPRISSKSLIGVVCWLYVLACLLPCIDGGPDSQSGDPGFPDFEKGVQFGFFLLLFGWGGGNNGVPWAANVALVFGLICLAGRRNVAALGWGILASVLGLTTWWVRRYDTLMIGYYVWQACLFLVAAGAVSRLLEKVPLNEESSEPIDASSPVLG